MTLKTEPKILRRSLATIIDYGLYLIFFSWLVMTYGRPNDEGGYTLSNDTWANVEVTVYEYDSENDESGEGCSFRQKEKITGWVKAIDENGFPNIWHSITAY